jgi:hypothetical protein
MTYSETVKYWEGLTEEQKRFEIAKYFAPPYDMGLVGASLIERGAINQAGKERWYKALIYVVRMRMGPPAALPIQEIRTNLHCDVARADADTRFLACYLACVADQPQHNEFDPRIIDPASGEIL